MYAPTQDTENWPAANCPYPPQKYPIRTVYVPQQGYGLVYPLHEQGYSSQQGLPQPNIVRH